MNIVPVLKTQDVSTSCRPMELGDKDRSASLGKKNSTSKSLTRRFAQTSFVFVSAHDRLRYAAESCSEILRTANLLFGFDCYSWTHVSGIDGLIGHAETADPHYVVLVGDIEAPWIPGEFAHADIKRILHSASHVCTVGAGVFIPLITGVLASSKIAVHQNFRTAVSEISPSANIVTQPTSHCKKFRSAVSSAAGQHMMIEIIAQKNGVRASNSIAEYLGLVPTTPGFQSKAHWRYQCLAKGNPLVCAALDLMANSLEFSLSIREIAEETCVSARQLERAFQANLGQSPLTIYRDLKLERARNLIEQTKLPLLEISIATGFCSAASLSKHYKKKYGVSPKDARVNSYCELPQDLIARQSTHKHSF